MFIPHVLNCGCPLIDFIIQDIIPSYIPIYAYNIGFTGQFKALSATAIQENHTHAQRSLSKDEVP